MKKLVSLITVLSIVFSILGTFTVFAAESGTCGKNLMWALDDSGTLTISGTGEMTDYEMSDEIPPWYGEEWETMGLIKKLVIEEGVTNIGGWAFSGLENLTSITLPDSLESIGYEAFMTCPALTSVTIPAGVKEIGDRAFGLCGSLVSINVDEGNPCYSSVDGVLFNKEKTDLIQFPIGRSDTSYTFLDSVTSIRYSAFEYDNNLTSIIIPDTIKSIGFYAFAGCENLADISIGNGVEEIGWSAFYATAYYNDETKWDNDVLYIGNYLIEAKQEISGDYEIKNGTRVITDSAFDGCHSLTSITIPDSVVGIGEWAFGGCKKITDIVIPNGVTKIGEYMFYNCDSLTGVTIPDSVNSIEEGAFFFCNKLTSVEIPNNVTSNGYEAFKYSGLTSIIIPDSVTDIGNDAFYYCNKLESVTIGGGVKRIGSSAFYNCGKLKDVYYNGTQEDWGKISIENYNSPLTTATIHYILLPTHAYPYEITALSLYDTNGNSIDTIPNNADLLLNAM